MNSSARNSRKLKINLTKRLIELQAKGYHFDYLILCNGQLLCIQNNRVTPVGAAQIDIVDQVFDRLSRRFKYVHTIDTGNGDMGVMITEAICTAWAII
ncbi:hypothetical protein DYU05_05855 [Mucilaginibacter terrenus]|uniref:Uncharacterized protein n=1 Tax=Mucilaginibacter terrenus TaxID=2482727 RepID=A0A3E2NVS7_9SPHI|nr:hypothetical protein [Mucilaginibacter terrenus]RFZ85124.1 hypothetical protein DYU05_05855 [Mucilaginibacter terrenus]